MDGPGRVAEGGSDRYRAYVERLYGLARSGMTLSLDPISTLLSRLDHPELAYPSVHVAGSNGKGSTAAFVAAILSAHGSRVGLYTSPHLVRMTERVQLIEGVRFRSISEEAFADALDEVDRAAPSFEGLSFFEVVTAAGFIALEAAGVDAGVIEAGLGARLDATRLADARVSVLTDLALEHTEILGHTIEEIAREKAAVARPHRPLVVAGGPAGAIDTIEGAAREIGADLYRIGKEIHVARRTDATFDLDLGDRRIDAVRLSLLGPHQGRNALLAAKAAVLFDPAIDEVSIRRGLAEAEWPGRMEVIRGRDGPRILLDGAHNAHGAEALAAALAAHRDLFAPPLHFVFGVLADKDADRMLSVLQPYASSLVLTRPDSPRARDPRELFDRLSHDARHTATVIEREIEALCRARERAAADKGWVVVCGSLYLVGAVRAWLLTSEVRSR
jgi:dihydrofolate synthase/folylpolyglutamate synthase